MPDWSSIKNQLKLAGVASDTSVAAQPVMGGDISAAWQLGNLFVKTGPPDAAEMLAAEAEGLAEISRSETVRVPEIALLGRTETDVFLALEWLEFEASDPSTEMKLGEQLAAMHHVTRKQFGWHRDNTIGLTPQLNAWSTDWVNFFREQRLEYQLRLAAENGFTGRLQEQGARLLKRLPIYFDNAEIIPSLLHGDLWGGNWASSNGEPTIFDPAVYYGDAESDLAMTRLFGGFGPAFYASYESGWPTLDGRRERQCLYQLYHILNHLNLFGSAYLNRASALMKSIL